MRQVESRETKSELDKQVERRKCERESDEALEFTISILEKGSSNNY